MVFSWMLYGIINPHLIFRMYGSSYSSFLRYEIVKQGVVVVVAGAGGVG